MSCLIVITNNSKKLAQELKYDSYAKPFEMNLDEMGTMVKLSHSLTMAIF